MSESDAKKRKVSSGKKVALVTGITGQDGSYLAEMLLEKGYEVHGIKRRASSFNQERIEHLFADAKSGKLPFYTHYGDVTDLNNLVTILNKVKPTEFYNLAAQSHVHTSFELPVYTAQVSKNAPPRTAPPLLQTTSDIVSSCRSMNGSRENAHPQLPWSTTTAHRIPRVFFALRKITRCHRRDSRHLPDPEPATPLPPGRCRRHAQHA